MRTSRGLYVSCRFWSPAAMGHALGGVRPPECPRHRMPGPEPSPCLVAACHCCTGFSAHHGLIYPGLHGYRAQSATEYTPAARRAALPPPLGALSKSTGHTLRVLDPVSGGAWTCLYSPRGGMDAWDGGTRDHRRRCG